MHPLFHIDVSQEFLKQNAHVIDAELRWSSGPVRRRALIGILKSTPPYLWCLERSSFNSGEHLTDMTRNRGYLHKEKTKAVRCFNGNSRVTFIRVYCEKCDRNRASWQACTRGTDMMCTKARFDHSVICLVSSKSQRRGSYLFCETSEQLHCFGQITFN